MARPRPPIPNPEPRASRTSPGSSFALGSKAMPSRGNAEGAAPTRQAGAGASNRLSGRTAPEHADDPEQDQERDRNPDQVDHRAGRVEQEPQDQQDRSDDEQSVDQGSPPLTAAGRTALFSYPVNDPAMEFT